MSLLVASVGTAARQEPSDWERQVIDRIHSVRQALIDNSYHPIIENIVGSAGAGQRQRMTATLRSGVTYRILAVCDDDCADLDLVLYDDAGNEVGSDLELDVNPVIDYTPDRTAGFEIGVDVVTCANEPCYYAVEVYGSRAPAADHRETHSGVLTGDDGKLTNGEYYDRHVFHAEAGQRIVVDLSSSQFDTYILLRSPDKELTENDDYEGSTGRSRVELVAATSGTWDVFATSLKPAETGGYALDIEVGDMSATSAPATAGGAAAGRTERGSLAAGDATLSSGEYRDEYPLSGAAGELVTIDLRSDAFDTYLMLVAPSGQQFENDDYEGEAAHSMLSMELPEAGDYRVVVTSYKPQEIGAYVLWIGRGNAVAAGPRRERGTLDLADLTLQSGEYVDTYTFEGRPGQHLRVDLSSTDFDTYVIVAGPGEDRAENDDANGSNSSVEIELKELGTYEVMVTSYEPGETGAYELSIETDAAAPTDLRQRDVRRIDIGGAAAGRLESGDGQLESGEYRDLFVFDGEVGQSIVLDMTSRDLDTYVGLIPPSGEPIENDDFDGRTDLSRVALTLRESGRYSVIATSYAAGETGAYELSLRAATAPAADTGVALDAGGVYGVFIGISDYPGEDNDLAYTADDARHVAQALTRGAGLRPGNSIVLTDAEATRANVARAIQEIGGRAGADDLFVFFFSGHGNRVPRATPQRADPDAMDETIEMYDAPIVDDELSDLLSAVRARISLIVLDACFSGGFAKDVISEPGRMGLFSSEEDVTSQVAAKFRAGGYLASFIADAVGDRLADADGDHTVTAIELSQYLHERYRVDVKAMGPEEYVRTSQLGYQHLVVDRGSVAPYQILFR